MPAHHRPGFRVQACTPYTYTRAALCPLCTAGGQWHTMNTMKALREGALSASPPDERRNQMSLMLTPGNMGRQAWLPKIL